MYSSFKKILSGILFIILSLSLCGCNSPTKLKNKAALALKTEDTSAFAFITAERGDVILSTDIPIHYKKQIINSIYYPIADKYKIVKTYVNVGDTVKEGDLLMECAPVDNYNNELISVEDELKKINDSLNEIKLEYDYNRKMADSEKQRIQHLGITDSENEHVKAALKYEESSSQYEKEIRLLNSRKKELESTGQYRLVYATKSGTISYIAKSGKWRTYLKTDICASIVENSFSINASTTNHDLFEVGKEYTALFNVLENENALDENGKLKEGVEYNYVEKPATMICKSIEVVNSDSNVGEIKFLFANNSNIETNLKSINGKIQFISKIAENVIRVPNYCVITNEEASIILVLNEKGERELRKVKVGLVGNTYTEITEGLKVGDKVITGSYVNGEK